MKKEFFIKGERDPGISRDPYRIETVISDPILKFRHRFRPDQ
jgi:hypothetical protein